MTFEKFKTKFQKKPVSEFENSIIENPIVSISVVTYQHVNYIKECLDGILMQQTTFPFEILLGDDASTDGTREICLKYAKLHPDKIRLFLHHRENNIAINGNPSGRFNFLYNLYNARGKYIALCEGDDYWTDPYKLQKQVDFMKKNPEYAACFTNINLLKNGEVYDAALKEKHKRDFNAKNIQDGFWIPTLTVVLRPQALPKPLPKQFSKAPNGDVFLFYILSQAGKIGYLDFISGTYRQHSGGVWTSSNFLNQTNSRILTLQLLKDYFKTETGMVSSINSQIRHNQWRKVEYYWKKHNIYMMIKEYFGFFMRYPLVSFKLVFLGLMKKIKKRYN